MAAGGGESDGIDGIIPMNQDRADYNQDDADMLEAGRKLSGAGTVRQLAAGSVK